MNEHNRMIFCMLMTSLLLMGFAFGEKGQMNQMFSRGLRLIVEVPYVGDHLVTPKVHVLLPDRVQSKRPGSVTLACVITGLQFKTVKITWKVNGANRSRKHTSIAEVRQEPGGTFSAVGLYSVVDHKWSQENTYKCEVTYRAGFHYHKIESSICNPREGFGR
ncbi:Ig lambda chain C region [Paramisgurnus dabryanus]|uniref:Ig lambda chain C region n=1 Tax=Paramisgurnus dabryanus TaxID=90735 RepID=UPI0031F37A1B